ncbi:MAG: sigma-70 family RNA polymerase sigma factor [Deltaproteobacteria bacterium]|nr:sigma-70 family RNA polymerase sigma factor [Deltaproteobacteria bacterium]
MNHVPPPLSQAQNRTRRVPSDEQRVSDEELLVRYQSGDEAAFDELFSRYRRRIFHFILRFLRDKNASEDALQDLFLRVIRDPSRFQARSRFSTWLHTVARNLCIDLLRKQKYRRVTSLDQPRSRSLHRRMSTPMIEEIKSPEASPETKARHGSLRLKLLVAIRSIPDDQRVVFLLREVGGLSFAEIAKIVGSPLNTTKSRMRYALINLRKVLREMGLPQ